MTRQLATALLVRLAAVPGAVTASPAGTRWPRDLDRVDPLRSADVVVYLSEIRPSRLLPRG
ncbi:hypothetical protein [Streptomyces sp. NPDC052701]|uniref:hypothetical protein n=1 Tax=Streptomyces sp. NPDC052701 TaxID=3155533 RepID=UPI003415DA0E